MKSIKQFVFALLFVSALVVNTYAGDLETPGLVPPPPPNHSMYTTTTEATSDGSQVAVTPGDAAETSDQLYYEALMAMLSLF